VVSDSEVAMTVNGMPGFEAAVFVVQEHGSDFFEVADTRVVDGGVGEIDGVLDCVTYAARREDGTGAIIKAAWFVGI
jgi:hypothetical protein